MSILRNSLDQCLVPVVRTLSHFYTLYWIIELQLSSIFRLDKAWNTSLSPLRRSRPVFQRNGSVRASIIDRLTAISLHVLYFAWHRSLFWILMHVEFTIQKPVKLIRALFSCYLYKERWALNKMVDLTKFHHRRSIIDSESIRFSIVSSKKVWKGILSIRKRCVRQWNFIFRVFLNPIVILHVLSHCTHGKLSLRCTEHYRRCHLAPSCWL